MSCQFSNLFIKFWSNIRYGLRWLLLLGFCCNSTLIIAANSGVVIKKAEVPVRNGWYMLDAEIDYRLSQVALQALNNGVFLQWTLQVKVYRKRQFLWDQKLADKKRRFGLRLHALMKMYQVTSLSNEKVDYYVTLAAALQAMGTIQNMPLIEQGEIQQDNQYFAAIVLIFDRDMLPVPLQPTAFVSHEWSLSSNQYLCPLKK